ncbi:NAD(P)-dependent dehydrogenase, short-chain alcohol dehydrogenase family [Aliiroseovarius crassostreae]|uniref:Oxidoreductase n=1 Tax=Aliiroseovarius crassostreae TaxID=154981 RepID=A0A0P7J4T5_9RHOB|nr:SDR family oxidoreductase [Aliiroseovarius crassostreae]KPN62808.1 oxidoreductase [Aliiroseovarius crassostreae]SFU71096.1 NAD(P)-dependent dehydrogenase, short-chain alcohol dehydrogenase family [Aliiroseovarius crassostreae]
MAEIKADHRKPIVAVTGASRGIGHAIVRHFHNNGWEVITLARTPFSDYCPWADGIVRHIEVDLSKGQSILDAAAHLRRLIGGRGLNALVNNAGISPKGPAGGRMNALNTPIQTFLDVQHVNLVAPLMLCQELMEPLRQVRGSVVNVSSIAAHQVHPFAGAAYAVSKSGLTTLTRELAHEFGHSGVRVNSVAPGEIETAILSPGTQEIVDREVPMKRLGRPEEVAEVVHFLASTQSSYVTGSEIPINGGQHI